MENQTPNGTENIFCNFHPKVIAITNIYANSDAQPERHIKLRLDFGEYSSTEEFTIPLSRLEKFDWLNQDMRCRFNPGISPSRVQRYLADVVREALPDAPNEKQYRLDRLGCHVIEGIPMFNTGGGLICPPLSKEKLPDVKPAPMPFRIDTDTKLTEAEAVTRMLDLVGLCPNAGRVILAHNLLYIMRLAYVSAWKSPCCCVFLYGKTQMKKTSFSALMTQMHNLSQGIVSPPRLNASISAAVASIYEKSDCVVVLDDLFPSDSKEVRRRQEETLIEITRVIGDGIEPARIRGNKVTKAAPTCGVLFTGEYPIGTGSSAARLLVVEMTLPDLERLREFQNNPLIVSTFYHWFAMWFISNYGDIVELLKEWHCAYTKTRFGVHDRLQETHFFLNTAYSLLLQYCYDKGFLSEQDAGVLYCSFFKLLTLLIRAQQERVEQGKAGEVEKIDFLSCIRAAYKGGKFFLADRAKSFKDGQHDGVIHNNELCLRAAKLRQLFPGISLDDIACDLLSQGALRTTGTGKREIQIYETGGRRFYAIPMSKIQ